MVIQIQGFTVLLLLNHLIIKVTNLILTLIHPYKAFVKYFMLTIGKLIRHAKKAKVTTMFMASFHIKFVKIYFRHQV